MHAGRRTREKGNKNPPPALSSEEDSACYGCGPTAEALKKKGLGHVQTISVADRRIVGKEPCSWFEIGFLAKELAKKTGKKKYDCILAIANGGIIPAKLVAEELGIDSIHLVPTRKKQVITSEMPRLDKSKKYLVVDDIYDTGKTYRKVAKALKGYHCDFAFCMSRYDQNAGICGRILNHNRWIVFPWEASTPR